MHGDILAKVNFVDAAKGAQEITQPRPKTLRRVDVGFSNAVAIQIFGPNPCAGLVTDTHVFTPGIVHPVVAPPFICVDGGIGGREGFDMGL